MLLGDTIPNFEVSTTAGKFKLHDYFGNSWGILFSHPADYTPVCTTELARAAQLASKFEMHNVKPIGLSCDTLEAHKGWIKDIQCLGKLSGDYPYPLIDDHKREIATKLGMFDPDEIGPQGIPLTARAVYLFSPDKKLKLSLLYPATTGRNFDEILRAIESIQLTTREKVATPVDWKPGTQCMIQPNVSEDEAKKLYPKHTVFPLPSGKPYMRYTSV